LRSVDTALAVGDALSGAPIDLPYITAAAARCPEVNAAVHSEICVVPDQRLLDERQVLFAAIISAAT
jgi:hypothetical protein